MYLFKKKILKEQINVCISIFLYQFTLKLSEVHFYFTLGLKLNVQITFLFRNVVHYYFFYELWFFNFF